MQDVTITGDGGVQLACGLVLPTGAAPDGGWPGIVFFPNGNSSYYNEPQVQYAEQGFASVACDERGINPSGGPFDLAGPEDAADAQRIFDWLAAQPEVSDRQIGAYGEGVGGAEVWDAAVRGVPFKAIVPVTAWSSLARLLHPSGGTDVVMLDALVSLGSPTWNTPAGLAARSYRAGIRSLTVPTLVIHDRDPDFFELSQATVPYRLLAGPKRLLVTWDRAARSKEALAWFEAYLAGGPNVRQGVEIGRARPDKTTMTFRSLPKTRSVSVNLPGTALKRRVWLLGTPLETFGGGSVTIRYSHASWKQVVAEVTAAKGQFVGVGAVPVTTRAGVLRIPLMNWMTFLPHGTKLIVTLRSKDTTFGGAPGGTITVGRVTLKLSVLERAVSH